MISKQVLVFCSSFLALAALGEVFSGKSVEIHTDNTTLATSNFFYYTKKPGITDWGNFDDKSGKEGDPNWPAKKFAWLNLPLGFGYNK